MPFCKSYSSNLGGPVRDHVKHTSLTAIATTTLRPFRVYIYTCYMDIHFSQNLQKVEAYTL